MMSLFYDKEGRPTLDAWRRVLQEKARENKVRDERKRKRLDQHLVSLLAPASFEAEQYRGLRSRIESRAGKSPLQAIAVTSAAMGDGKSTTTVNLAGALAQSRQSRVLVIDADLRCPSVGRLLGHGDARTPGLTDAIVSDRPLDSLVQHWLPFNLAVLTAGQASGSPYEILRSPRLAAIFEEARRHYNYVVVDTPPLLPEPDGRLIAAHVDGLLIVVGANKTPRRMLAESLELLEPEKVIGLVFNGDEHALRGYKKYFRAYARAQAAEAASIDQAESL